MVFEPMVVENLLEYRLD